MNITIIKTFLLASETKNVSKTANLLNYSQSTVSGHIEKLEKELGVELFYRKKYGMELTKEGLTYVKYAQKIINSNIEFEKELRGLYEKSESIVVNMQESQYIYKYSNKINEWMKENPHVNVTFKTAHSNFYIKEELSNLETDIALITDENIINNGLFTNVPISRDKLVLVTNQQLSSFNFHDLEETTLLLTEKGCSYREQIEKLLFSNDINPMQKLEFIGIESLKLYIKNFGGIALLPEFTVKNELRNQDLFELSSEYRFPELKTNIFYNQDTKKASIKSFIEYVFNIK
ncbi:LysR family transcriptional regulator [Staphylococcus kloosii]|uniref:LysR family transcriptional regulator n=1 Tax=Staphylococcus kloosii TaxID=29384 RepID=UPI00189DF7A1|nr:LysR family transcriptional regulator [Staphylococcus kloosii]MBF7028508.1 LysR family transcriptional regulator [Staphylococcus kloosii]